MRINNEIYVKHVEIVSKFDECNNQDHILFIKQARILPSTNWIMEESIRQNASIALHRYLSHNITGTEKHVKTIRMMNNAKDYLQTMRNCTFITSGSFGEGLVMRGSDLDVMYVCKFAEVCEDKNVYLKPNITYFEMETEDCQPCFVRLRLRYFTGRFFFGSFLEEMGGNYYLSNAKLKEQMTDLRCPTIHGPCLSDTNDTLDIALCFRSTSWIPQAQHWVTRSNNSWPSYDVKKSIIQHGVLFVPIGVKGSPKEDLDWRISFSVAEKILIYSFTHTQFLCYVLMKILLKDVIAIDLSCKELLCSYFMKTIVFWISEEISPSVWKPNNLIPLFMRCFRRLLYCVEYLVCPHFFVPENNLFENKINKYARVILLNKLHILNSYGWKCILFSDQIPNGHKLTSRLYKDQSCSHIDIRKLLFSRIFYIAYQAHMRSFDYEKAIHLILSLESSKIKYLYLHFMSKFSCISDQFQPFEFTSGNKFTYKKYNTRLSSLLQNMHHDAVSGWLMLASFFYKRKQYYIALDILQYSLSKCSSEKLYRGMNASLDQHALLNLNLLKNMSIPKLCKFMLVNVLDLISLRPKDIPEEGEGIYNIPPVVYAYFLCFLCHYHLKNTSKYRDSIRDLQTTIDTNYFTGNSYEKYVSYNTLGLTFELSGNKKSAKRAYKQALKFKPKNRVGW